MFRCLVTGGTGFIGSNLTKKLLQLGNHVIITGSHAEAPIPEGAEFLGVHLDGIDWHRLRDIDYVFHQAANNDTLDQDKIEMHRANVSASKTLFNRLYERGCRKFIFASSTAVYGNSPAPYFENKTMTNPLNPYGESKLELEHFAKYFASAFDVEFCIGLRYCNIYGPGESHKGHRASMIWHLINKMGIKNENPILFKDGNQKRDWCYVDDVVMANIQAASFDKSEIPNKFDVYNVGSGSSVSFNQLIDIISKKLGKQFTTTYIDNPNEESYQNYTECDICKWENKWSPEFDVESGIEKYLKKLGLI